MSHVSVNWVCDKCGRKCSDLTCIMCDRKLKDYRDKLLEANMRVPEGVES